jgi:hypothetical protein
MIAHFPFTLRLSKHSELFFNSPLRFDPMSPFLLERKPIAPDTAGLLG